MLGSIDDNKKYRKEYIKNPDFIKIFEEIAKNGGEYTEDSTCFSGRDLFSFLKNKLGKKFLVFKNSFDNTQFQYDAFRQCQYRNVDEKVMEAGIYLAAQASETPLLQLIAMLIETQIVNKMKLKVVEKYPKVVALLLKEEGSQHHATLQFISNNTEKDNHNYFSKSQIVGVISLILIVFVSAFYFFKKEEIELIDSQYGIKPVTILINDPKTGLPKIHFQRPNKSDFRELSNRELSVRSSYEELAEHYRKEIEKAKKRKGFEPSWISWLYILLGQALSGIEPNEAIKAYQVAVDLDTTSSLARLGLGYALMNIGKIEQAFEQIDLADSLVNESDHVELALVKSSKASLLILKDQDFDTAEKLLYKSMNYMEAAGETEWGLQIAIQLSITLFMKNDLKRGANILVNVVGPCEELKFKRLIGTCFEASATFYVVTNQDTLAEQKLKLALNAYVELQDKFNEIRMRVNLVESVIDEEGITSGENILNKALEDARELEFIFGQIHALNNLSNVAGFHRQNHALALQLEIEAIELARQYPDINYLGDLLRWAGSRANIVGDYQRAWEYEIEALDIAVKLNQEFTILSGAIALTKLAKLKEDKIAEKKYFNQSDKILSKVKTKKLTSSGLKHYAEILMASGDFRQIEFWKLVLYSARKEENKSIEYEALLFLSLNLSDINELLKYRKQMVKLSEQSGDSLMRESAYLYLGKSYYLLKKYDLALDAYKTSSAMQSGNKLQALDLAISILKAVVPSLDQKIVRPAYKKALEFDLKDVPGYVLDSMLIALIKAAYILHDDNNALEYAKKLVEIGHSVKFLSDYFALSYNAGIVANDTTWALKYFDYYIRSLKVRGLVSDECKISENQVQTLSRMIENDNQTKIKIFPEDDAQINSILQSLSNCAI